MMKSPIMNKILLNCKNAVELIEKEKFENIGLFNNIKLNMHTAMCKYCSTYKSQSEIIHKAFISKLMYSNGYQASDEFKQHKEKIKNSINKLLDKQ
jgi:hypothetical protein